MKHMKKTVSVLLLAALAVLPLLPAGCGSEPPVIDTIREVVSDAPSDPAAPVSRAEPTTEPSTEPETTRAVDRRAESVYAAHPELTPLNYDSPALLPSTEDAGQAYIDGIVCLCDSPIYWLKLYELLKDGYNTNQVWTGPEGTMTLAYLRGFEILDPNDGALRTIPETAALRKPPVILITVGVNGIAFMDEDYFKTEYRNLIDELQAASPDTRLILQSILPITRDYIHWGSITNEIVTRANSWIVELAEEYGLPYLDTFSALVDENGNGKAELMQGDGLHPNRDGQTLILEYIRTHADPAALAAIGQPAAEAASE